MPLARVRKWHGRERNRVRLSLVVEEALSRPPRSIMKVKEKRDFCSGPQELRVRFQDVSRLSVCVQALFAWGCVRWPQIEKTAGP